MSCLAPADREAMRRATYYQPDDIELLCAGCTPEWGEAAWSHERSCVFRGRVL